MKNLLQGVLKTLRAPGKENMKVYSVFLYFFSFCIPLPPSLPPLPPSLSLSESGWFEVEDSKNHNIYVSGLPHDITLEEFEQLMSKYGIIMEDDDGGCGFVSCLYYTLAHMHMHYIHIVYIHTHRGT